MEALQSPKLPLYCWRRRAARALFVSALVGSRASPSPVREGGRRRLGPCWNCRVEAAAPARPLDAGSACRTTLPDP